MKNIFTIFALILFMGFFSSQIVFEYDVSGNQSLREYQAPKTSLLKHTMFMEVTTLKETTVYPNPVVNELFITWDTSIINFISKIEMVAYNGNSIENIKFLSSQRKTTLDMSSRPLGVYYLKIYLTDGRVFSHSIIKN